MKKYIIGIAGLFVVMLALVVCVFFGSQLLDRAGAPDVSPMKLAEVKRDILCVPITAPCNTLYYYIGRGNVQDVTRDVYDNFRKNPNYTVSFGSNPNSIYVDYKNVDPNEQDGRKLGFGVDLIQAPKSPNDAYIGFFVPTKDCNFGSTDCVEALIVK